MTTPTRYVATLLLSVCLLAGCGDDSGDSAEDPAPSSDASAGGEPAADAPTGAHPCDVLTGEEVQPVIDAPVTAREADGAGGRTCVYEPGADAPLVKVIAIEDQQMLALVPDMSEDLGKEVQQLETPGLDISMVVTDPKKRGAAVAYAGVGDAGYEIQVEAGGLDDSVRIAEQLLPLFAD